MNEEDEGNKAFDLDDLIESAKQGNDLEIEMVASDASAFERASPLEQLGAIYDVPVQLSAVLGKASMPISQLLRLGRGAVLELDRKVGESIDILVNNRLVARGEVVIVDERIGVTMTEIIKSDG
jgi:flagellar motor switch protein FliN